MAFSSGTPLSLQEVQRVTVNETIVDLSPTSGNELCSFPRSVSKTKRGINGINESAGIRKLGGK